jgi:hypothetical protein
VLNARFRASLLLSLILFCAPICSASRVSGTYVGHGANFAEMLQLTETENGQMSGVLSWAELKGDGRVTSEQAPVTGVVDADQVTLNIRSGLLSFLVGNSVAGTVKGDAIQLQTVDSSGNVANHVFARGTAADFKTYADQLKSRGANIVFSNKLTNGARQFRQTVQDAEQWIANAELHAQRIPTVRTRYQEIEAKMQSLVATERTTSNAVERSQLSVSVNQGDIAGEQVDIGVEQVWDINIGEPGKRIADDFAKWDGKCGETAELQRRGANGQSAEAWESACKQALAEREKFIPIFRKIMEQRAELKSFEAAAQTRRKAIVTEANRIQ